MASLFDAMNNPPSGRWFGNVFQLPQIPEIPPWKPMPAQLPAQAPVADVLQTSALSPQGSGGGKGSARGDFGPDLARGPADIGYTRGEATADTTTTATDSTKDFAKSALAGLGGPLTAASYALTGQTPASYALSKLGEALGLTTTPQPAALAPQIPGVTPDPYAGGAPGQPTGPNTPATPGYSDVGIDPGATSGDGGSAK